MWGNVSELGLGCMTYRKQRGQEVGIED